MNFNKKEFRVIRDFAGSFLPHSTKKKIERKKFKRFVIYELMEIGMARVKNILQYK